MTRTTRERSLHALGLALLVVAGAAQVAGQATKASGGQKSVPKAPPTNTSGGFSTDRPPERSGFRGSSWDGLHVNRRWPMTGFSQPGRSSRKPTCSGGSDAEVAVLEEGAPARHQGRGGRRRVGQLARRCHGGRLSSGRARVVHHGDLLVGRGAMLPDRRCRGEPGRRDAVVPRIQVNPGWRSAYPRQRRQDRVCASPLRESSRWTIARMK